MACAPIIQMKINIIALSQEFCAMRDMVMSIYGWMEEFGEDKYTLDEPSYHRMLKLMSLTNRIARDGRSTRRSIWVKVPGGFHGTEWLNITFHGDCYAPGDIFYEVQIDGVQVLSYDSKRSEGEILDATEMLDWLIESVTAIIKLVGDGRYEEYISDVPYARRRGVISRKDYYAIVPDARKKYASSLSQDEIDELYKSGGTTDFQEDAMTARRFYEACAVVYRALDLEMPEGPGFHGWIDGEEERSRYGDLTPKEWYYAVADCRDDGLFEVPLDDADYFRGWLEKKEPFFKWGNYGGHPWDIINKYSYSLSLCVDHDLIKGSCKLRVIGDSAERSSDIVRAYLALRKAGYSVVLDGYDVLMDRLLEKDYLGVVEEVKPWQHGNTIAGQFIRDEISLSEFKDGDVLDNLIKTIKWENLDEVKLSQDTGILDGKDL